MSSLLTSIRKTFLSDNTFQLFEALPKLEKPMVLVVGGSQGAQSINETIHQEYSALIEKPYGVIHITGEDYYKHHFTNPEMTVSYNSNGEVSIITCPYFERMDYLYEKAHWRGSRYKWTSKVFM